MAEIFYVTTMRASVVTAEAMSLWSLPPEARNNGLGHMMHRFTAAGDVVGYRALRLHCPMRFHAKMDEWWRASEPARVDSHPHG